MRQPRLSIEKLMRLSDTSLRKSAKTFLCNFAIFELGSDALRAAKSTKGLCDMASICPTRLDY